MTHDPSTCRDEPAAACSASLHRVLEQDYSAIERGIAEFLASGGDAVTSLRASIAALRRHIYLEQEFLFPSLRRAGEIGPVFAMSSDHEDLWRTLDQLDEQLADGSPQQAQQQTCRILMAELDEHVSKEDPIVFGHAEEVLTVDEQATLRESVQNAPLPPGWVCPEPASD